MKKSVFILFLVFTSLFTHAQKLKFSKTEIRFDGEVALLLEKDWGAETVKIFDLQKNLLITMTYKHGLIENYIAFYFVKANREFTSSKLTGYFHKGIIKRMVKDGVLDKTGHVDEEQLELFIKIYR